MEIGIELTITNEYLESNYRDSDINDLENYLRESFAEKSYGESVVKYFFGFELYKFNGGFAQFFNNDIEKWLTKNKWFVTNAHFDWNHFITLNPEEILNLIKVEFVKSIGRIENMKRKPKHFDYKSFQKDFEEVMNDYIIKNNSRQA